MERLVVDGFGKSVSAEGTNVVVREYSGGERKTLYYVPAESLRQVIITGKGSITVDAINLLAKNQVDVVVIDYKGEVTAKVSGEVQDGEDEARAWKGIWLLADSGRR